MTESDLGIMGIMVSYETSLFSQEKFSDSQFSFTQHSTFTNYYIYIFFLLQCLLRYVTHITFKPTV